MGSSADPQNLQFIEYKKTSKGFTALLVTGQICNTVGDSYAIKLDNLFTSLTDYAFASAAINTVGVADGTYPFDKNFFTNSPLDTFVYNLFFTSEELDHDDKTKAAFKANRMAVLEPQYQEWTQNHVFNTISDVGYYKTAKAPFNEQYTPQAISGAFEHKTLSADAMATQAVFIYYDALVTNIFFDTLYTECKKVVAEINKEWVNFLTMNTNGRPNRVMLVNTDGAQATNVGILGMLATDPLLANPPTVFNSFSDAEKIQFLTMLPLVTLFVEKAATIIINSTYAIGRMIDLKMISGSNMKDLYYSHAKAIVDEVGYLIKHDPNEEIRQSMTEDHYVGFLKLKQALIAKGKLTQNVAEYLNHAWTRQYDTFEATKGTSSPEGKSPPKTLHDFGTSWYANVNKPQ